MKILLVPEPEDIPLKERVRRVNAHFVYTNALQAIGAAGYSFLLSISRQGIIFIPCLLVFNRFFHLDGAVAAQPIADILSLILAIWLFRRSEIEHLRT